jgi:hypothetical protein
MTARRALSDQLPGTVAAIALEIDVQTALALSRATTRAVTRISPQAHLAIVDELKAEAELHEAQGGPVADMVATLLQGHLDQLK